MNLRILEKMVDRWCAQRRWKWIFDDEGRWEVRSATLGMDFRW